MTVNLDHTVAGRFGGLMPAGLLRLARTGPTSAATTRDLGRGVLAGLADHGAGLRFASLFWFLTAFVMLAATFVSLIAIGETFGRELLDGPVRIVPALFAGGMVGSMAACAIAGYRYSELVPLRYQSDPSAEIPRRAVPRPSDSWIAIGAGVLGAAIVYLST